MKKQLTVAAAALMSLTSFVDAKGDTITEVASKEGGYYTMTESKTFKNVDLHYVTGPKATVSSSFGWNPTVTYIVSEICDSSAGVNGIYFWSNDGTTATGQIQWIGDSGYTYSLRIQLVQSGSDVVATLLQYRYTGNKEIGVDLSTKGNNGTFMTADYAGNDTGAIELAFVDMALLVSDERQIAEDDEWDGAGSGTTAGDTLIWNGGAEGTWDSTTENWLTTNSVAIRWVKGCIAKFPSAANVTMTSAMGRRNVGGFAIGDGQVTLSGDQVVLLEPASVVFNGDGTLLFNNDIVGESGLVQKVRERNDVYVPESFVDSDLGDADFTSTEDVLLFQNASLANIETLRGTIYAQFGGASPVERTVNTTANDYTDAGLYFYSNDGSSATMQFQAKSNSGYGGVYHCVKIQLSQVGADIYGKVLYIRSGTCQHHLGDGWSLGYDWDENSHTANSYSTRLYGLQIGTSAYTIYDQVPSNSVISIAGDCSVSGTHVISNGTLKLVGSGTLGDGNFVNPITFWNDGTIIHESSAAQTFNASITDNGDGMVRIASGSTASIRGSSASGKPWNLEVAGNASASDYGALPVANGGSINVLPGGNLSLLSFYYEWGPDGDSVPMVVHTNGTLTLTKENSIGVKKAICLEGGTMTNETTDVNLIYKLYMRDGAKVSGVGYRVGYTTYYNSWSFIDVGGSEPSLFDADTLMIGYQVPAGENKPVGVKLIVADVTQSDDTDLTFASRFTEREADSLYNEGYRENLGIWKQGEGTIELTGAGSCATSGVFKIEAGTVRLGAGSSGEYGACILLGDATIDGQGGTIEFDDSSAFAWTDGATLNLTGNVGKRKVRFGKSAEGLTAAQLAAITVNGKAGKATLDGEGWISVFAGLKISIR